MTFDQTSIENSTALLPVVQTVNTWSNGILGIVLVAVIAIVMFASTRGQDTRTAFVVVTFISTMSASVLYLLQLVTQGTVGFLIALFVGSLIHYFLTT